MPRESLVYCPRNSWTLASRDSYREGRAGIGRPQRGRTTLSTEDGVLTVDELRLGDREGPFARGG